MYFPPHKVFQGWTHTASRAGYHLPRANLPIAGWSLPSMTHVPLPQGRTHWFDSCTIWDSSKGTTVFGPSSATSPWWTQDIADIQKERHSFDELFPLLWTSSLPATHTQWESFIWSVNLSWPLEENIKLLQHWNKNHRVTPSKATDYRDMGSQKGRVWSWRNAFMR